MITTVRIPNELYERVLIFCKEKEMKLAGLIRLGIKRILDENGKC